jgi:hypothetical protein
MFLSIPVKFLSAVGLAFFLFAGCSLLSEAPNRGLQVAPEVVSGVPFTSKEPDDYQCDVLVTAGDVARRYRVARAGSLRRVDFDVGTPQHRAYLEAERIYIMDIGRRTYAEVAVGPAPSDELIALMLARREWMNFEPLPAEGGLTRFRAVPLQGSRSEIVIGSDPAIPFPVRQELFSLSGSERRLSMLVEVTGFTALPEAEIFRIPSGFRRVSPEEIRGAR